eukprot:TRINITY_DN68523_c0_g1_i1.p1 TRINITY_DN68523_c0_g1~~TRINITY_DN68523_c0_g1_i1.p1  ORF type:complete len:742 (-),score=17.45 TRINITY_DN68523_c0_g1_i1:829-3054(-)
MPPSPTIPSAPSTSACSTTLGFFDLNDGGLIFASLLNFVVTPLIILLIAICSKRTPFKRHFRQNTLNTLDQSASSTSPFFVPFVWSWYPATLEELISQLGGDLAFFLSLMRTLWQACLCFAPAAIAVLVVNVLGNWERDFYCSVMRGSVAWKPGITQWGIANIKPGSGWIWLHWAVSIYFSIGVWFVVFRLYRHFLVCIRDARRSGAQPLTVMVYNSNREVLRDSKTWKEAYQLNDEGIAGVHIPREIPKNMRKLVTQREELLKKIAHADAYQEKWDEPEKMVVIKKCGRREAKPELEARLAKVNAELQPKQQEFTTQSRPTGVVFCTCTGKEQLQLNVQQLTTQDQKLKLRRPPAPTEVRWEHLHKGGIPNLVIHIIITLLFIALLFVWSIPIGFLSNLDNLARIPGIGKGFARLLKFTPTFTNFLNGYMPLIVATVFNLILPKIMEFATELEAPHTEGAFISRCYRKYFGFSFCVLVFFQAIFAGGLIGIPALLETEGDQNHAEKVLQLISSVVSPTVPLFVVMLLNAGMMGSWVRALRISPLALETLKVKKALNAEEVVSLYNPEPIIWWREYVDLFLPLSITMLFSVTVPLVALLSVVFLGGRLLAWNYLAWEVYPRKPTSSLHIAHSLFQTLLVLNDLQQIGIMGTMAAKQKQAGVYMYIAMLVVSALIHVVTWRKMSHIQSPPFAQDDTHDVEEPLLDQQPDEGCTVLGEAYCHPWAKEDAMVPVDAPESNDSHP